MKKIFQYIILIILFSASGIILKNKTAVRETVLDVRENISDVTGIGLPCSEPFQYAIGTVDPRFKLSTNDFLVVASEAEKLWEDQSGKNLFKYNPDAQFKINLIFDERQQASIESDKLTQDLNQLEVSRKQITTQYGNLSEDYTQKMAKYNADVAVYEKKMKNYNKKVESLNKQGGATEKDLADLKKEKENLADLRDKLEKERLEINKLAGKTNTLASKEKKVVNEYNANISTYKNNYGDAKEFEKGLYDGKEINIYQFKQIADLRLTIIHELGHSLGIGHTNDPQSIMYYLLSDQSMENPQLMAEDLSELATVCKFK